jgi:hypothetical protein
MATAAMNISPLACFGAGNDPSRLAAAAHFIQFPYMRMQIGQLGNHCDDAIVMAGPTMAPLNEEKA